MEHTDLMAERDTQEFEANPAPFVPSAQFNHVCGMDCPTHGVSAVNARESDFFAQHGGWSLSTEEP